MTHPIPTAAADICIIGAGSSGMTVAKSLTEAGLRVDVFEKGSNIGGMWRYQNDNGQSSCYASLHIDTSRPNLGYSDFPLSPDLPDFPSHAQFLKHLEAYADHFDLRRLVQFNSEVAHVSPNGTRFDVQIKGGKKLSYGTVIVANGHLFDPRLPEFEGSFHGAQIHSHHYRTADPYAGQRVMVVGLGNSAVDIAVDMARRAAHVFVSTRRSAWVMPKYLFGMPTDQVSARIGRTTRLPTRHVRRIMSLLVRLVAGDQRRFGLPRPAHPMWREHATLSQELLPYVGHGYLTIKPDVARLNGDQVAFVDGTQEQVDAIIYATGYNIRFPFLAHDTFDPDADAGQLYRRMVSLRYPNLIFAGLVQPIGPTITLVEKQGKWIAALLSGKIKLPDSATQKAEVATHQAAQKESFVDSKRYVLEVDYATYAKQMRDDLRAS